MSSSSSPPSVSSEATSPVRIYSRADFDVLEEIGDGSFSVVHRARLRDDGRECAIKMCFKKQILREKKVHQIMREKEVLALLSRAEHRHPLVLSLLATFHDQDHLYFVLQLAQGHDLLRLLRAQPNGRMHEEAARFYTAELLVALQHVHSLGVVHRDVKPENVLLSARGHVLLSDFGSACFARRDPPESGAPGASGARRCSFAGTAQFVSPEVLRNQPTSEASDLWALGVLLFQLLTGRHCFHDESEYLIFRRIEQLLFSFPSDFPAGARECVEGVLRELPSERLTASQLRALPFFAGLPFDALHESTPPLVPPAARSPSPD